jgi:DNA-binding beta-propeller fold protein YncE
MSASTNGSDETPLSQTADVAVDLPDAQQSATVAAATALEATVPPGPSVKATSRRRKGLLLLILASAVATLLMIGGWYLLFRQPITALPVPGITQPELPHYVSSIYGVTAPVGVAVDPSGDRIYVTEAGAQRLVHIYDGKGSEVGTFTPPKSTPATRVPVYLALDPLNGDVYVSDRPSASIYVFDRDGAFRRRFEPARPLDPFAPLGLAFDRQGNLFVSDVGGPVHRILEFDRDGVLLRSIGDPGQFSFPNGLAIDSLGNLFVADSNNGRVSVIDPTGRQIGAIPRGVASGELGLPRGAAIDPSGRLYVSDSTGQVVRVYAIDRQTARPTYTGAVGVGGIGDGQFQYPNGVATDSRARVYVVDWANDRVQVWSY